MTTPTTTFWIILKNTSYVMAFIAGIEYLNITPISIVVLTIFIVIDVITGIAKSIYLYGGSSIQSSIWQRGVLAKCMLLLLPLLIAGAGKGVQLNLSSFAQGMITVLVFSELYSIVGNIYAIKTGTDKKEFDAIAYVLEQLKNILKRVIQDGNPTL